MRNQRAFPGNIALVLFLTLFVLTLPFYFVAAAAAQQDPVVKIKYINVVRTSPADGSEMYAAYCAVCHGTTGKGNGPAAPAFNHQPTNLTLLTKTNSGKFPERKVYSTLLFGNNVPAHGNAKMPVWNNIFRQMDSSLSPSIPEIRIRVLTEYIKTLQAR